MFRKITTLIVFLLLLTACSSEEVRFYGESDYWEADLKITQNSGALEEQEFLLKYAGEDADSVGNFAYSVDSIGGSFGREGEPLEENGSIRDKRETTTGNNTIPEDAEIEVKVEWNGNTETFTLTQQ
jgi:hypothetical protein